MFGTFKFYPYHENWTHPPLHATRPLYRNVNHPGVHVPCSLVSSRPQSIADDTQHHITTPRERNNKRIRILSVKPSEHNKPVAFWPSHQTAWRNSKAPYSLWRWTENTRQKQQRITQEKIQKYNRPEMDTTTHNTLNIKRLGESHTQFS